MAVCTGTHLVVARAALVHFRSIFFTFSRFLRLSSKHYWFPTQTSTTWQSSASPIVRLASFRKLLSFAAAMWRQKQLWNTWPRELHHRKSWGVGWSLLTRYQNRPAEKYFAGFLETEKNKKVVFDNNCRLWRVNGISSQPANYWTETLNWNFN